MLDLRVKFALSTSTSVLGFGGSTIGKATSKQLMHGDQADGISDAHSLWDDGA